MRPIRVVATADLQLGMRRRTWLDTGAQARFDQARLDGLRAVAELASARGAEALLIAGDMFESSRVDRAVIRQACEALAGAGPVVIVPGNHDPQSPGSVWQGEVWRRACPPGVVVAQTSGLVAVGDRLEVVAAPWPAARVEQDLCAAALAGAPPRSPGRVRILVGHGAVDQICPDRENPAAIALSRLETGLDGELDAVVLGDRHSTTSVGSSGRIWYPGAPEPTDWDEVDSGNALVLTVGDGPVEVEKVAVGAWTMPTIDHELRGDAGVADLCAKAARITAKSRALLRVRLSGWLTASAQARLDGAITELGEMFAAVVVRGTPTLVATATDIDSLALHGYARLAAERLLEQAGDDPVSAAALALLHRLGGKAA